ncbi:SCP2 sterol-binding domain-containing protein [Nocardia sp. CDC153]|uniref:SCP2 sterol-binding domain-containing protein n=1 Tax=Nocardia sp. CDC153 TaxID=3112167 RepID=UPI002DC0433C|nr:SCP2 sterol-binding domain-containing protein [Nocardia sp. CDC153]MEC3957786.1 SCP2 sterol-binding domain-containing protein [Nocardia sp. CDC153]
MTLTVGELFDELPGRLRSEAATGVESTLQWQLTDLDPGVWAIEIKDCQGRLIPGGVPEPDTTFTTTSDIWLAIAEGRQDAMKAFMTGKMKVEGDMTLALRVPELFDTTS